MEKLTTYAKQTALYGVFFVFVVLFIFASTPKVSALLNDGNWWGNCSGRFTVGSVTSGTIRVTAYGCTNGYFFTHTSSTRYGQIFASMTRTNPSYANMIGRVYGYAATSNMVSRVNGGRYEVWGYGSNGATGATGFVFTW